MNSYVKYQQGDVLMLRINDDPGMIKSYNDCIKNNTKKTLHSRKNPTESSVATVALGEATGHHHSIDVMHEENADCEIINWYNSWSRFNTGQGQGLGRVPEYVEVKNAPATIKHQEHEAITLPTGIYRVRIVKEYDPFSNTTRGVAD